MPSQHICILPLCCSERDLFGDLMRRALFVCALFGIAHNMCAYCVYITSFIIVFSAVMSDLLRSHVCIYTIYCLSARKTRALSLPYDGKSKLFLFENFIWTKKIFFFTIPVRMRCASYACMCHINVNKIRAHKRKNRQTVCSNIFSKNMSLYI